MGVDELEPRHFGSQLSGLLCALCPPHFASRVAGPKSPSAAPPPCGCNRLTVMPASQAPFAIGDAVRFLPDPNHVERVIECQWICPDAPAHWRLVTAWTDDSGQHIRIGDAAEFVSERCSPDAP